MNLHRHTDFGSFCIFLLKCSFSCPLHLSSKYFDSCSSSITPPPKTPASFNDGLQRSLIAIAQGLVQICLYSMQSLFVSRIIEGKTSLSDQKQNLEFADGAWKMQGREIAKASCVGAPVP